MGVAILFDGPESIFLDLEDDCPTEGTGDLVEDGAIDVLVRICFTALAFASPPILKC